MITSFDWSQTAIGPVAGWAPGMHCVVEAFLPSPLPILSLWGSEGLALYNDAFASLIGDLHPALLGASIVEAWPGDPQAIRSIMALDALHPSLRIERLALALTENGVSQVRSFAVSCNGVRLSEGVPQGTLCVFVEAPAQTDPALDAEDRRQRRQALLLRVADEFRLATEREGIVDLALAAIGEEVGATAVGHADIDVAHDAATFDVGPDIGSMRRQSGTLEIERLVPGRGAELRNGRSIAENSPARLVVPLVREGRPRSLFLIDRDGSASWSGVDVGLAEDIASRAWEAMERIQAAGTLRRNQARQAFLLVLGDRLRETDDPDEIMETTAEALGRHLKVSRAGYGETSVDREMLFRTGWSDGSVTPFVGQVGLDQLGASPVASLGKGLTVTFDGDAIPSALTIGLRSLVAVPLIRDGRLRGALFLGHREERRWSAEDVALVGEVAARLWEALERARAEATLHDLNATLENRVAQRTQELTTSEARFRTLFANAPAPIFLIRVGSAGEAIYDAVNAATERFMGKDARDLVGQGVSQRTSTGEALLDHCLRSAETGQPVEYQLSVESDGDWRTAECVLAPLPIEDDETQLLIGIARDITAQRNAEDQLRQAQKMEAIGQLTGGIAHDFNNLLTGIIGSLALMEKRLAQGKTEAIARYLGLAMTSANRAAALTHRLLAFSRRQPLEAKPVDVGSLVTSMDELLRRTLGEGVTMKTIEQPGIWMTMCDPHQLENALLNLAINARDAMPDGGRLTLQTANTAVDSLYASREIGIAPGDYVVLSVTDTGIGMPQDIIARAFDPFFTTKPIGQGTGLGLSMIYGFAKQSEGHVKIYSEVGVGTTIKIFLPRFRGPDQTSIPQTVAGAPRAETGESVLVVEDDETVRGLVVETLQDLGYLAIEAVDGPSGLNIIHSARRIDLMVTDVGLPGMNGRQLAEQARTHRPDLNVLFITGYAENAAFGAGHLESGMQMMTKPFTVDELATRIRSILRVGQAEVADR